MLAKLGHHGDKKGLDTHSKDNSFLGKTDDLVELLIDIESPPCVLYGSATESTGALLSGLLKLRVHDPFDTLFRSEPLSPVTSSSRKKKNVSNLNSALSHTLSHLSLSSPNITPTNSGTSLNFGLQKYTKICVKSVTLSFVQKVTYSKPFLPSVHAISSCMNCRSKTTELARWDIVTEDTNIPIGDHAYPFSNYLPGSIPATARLGADADTDIKYELIAIASYRSLGKTKGKSNDQSITQLRLPISVTRSILRGPDRNSLRVFPPTDLTATAVLPNVVYPKSTFPLELKIDGVSTEDRRWRMRRLNWRIEEKARVRLNACDMHKAHLEEYEKKVEKSEALKKKRNAKPAKRAYDAGPTTTTSIFTLENAAALIDTQEASQEDNQGQNVDDDQPASEENLIHPSDDALREERLEVQQRIRQERLQPELKHETALFTEEIRTVACGEVKDGWKSDFSGAGKIELVTDIDCMELNSGVTNPINRASSSKPIPDTGSQRATVACDTEDPHLSVFVQHFLILELVVAEEALQYANGQPIVKKASSASSKGNQNNAEQRLAELSPMFVAKNATVPDTVPTASGAAPSKDINNARQPRIMSVATGAARVLRMQFRLTITERSGLGISWDDEVPPTYQDVRLLSPPSYEKSMKNPPAHVGKSFAAVQPTASLNEIQGDRHRFSSQGLSELSRPPRAHHHCNTTQPQETVLHSPPLESIISIQGNACHDHIMTPQNTRNVGLPNVSEVFDTDRITQ
ncbi:LAMI_0F06524g1_1 [Lachancea mirantina]|uniref:LAMI_0F06524g1_1 n=1 Tax=Lachancea mirantina TaxID=1230905 RepID=A0A1G4JZ83_9SACH|nr:LAMI_0F06524g1_1 [Lachancea mirantina]